MTNEPGITYAQLLETNNLIQQLSDESYWLCLTRTVQGSKLFPVSPYILLSYLMAFYRYPEILRKIERAMPAEEIGDRSRNMGIKIQNSMMGWAMPSFYLLGRELLITMGMIRAEDAVSDVVYVLDFWKRFQLAWHRNDGHLTNQQYGHRDQILPERTLQVFHADLYDCTEGEPLHAAAHQFMSAASQYAFLISCESRTCLHNGGPYNLGGGRELVIRNFMDLAENSVPWLDDVARDLPYNNLTVTMAAKDCHFHLMDDWGSFESEPEFRPHHLCGVGLYTSDALSEGYLPVAMGSAEELTAMFADLTERVKAATNALWQRIAGWNRDQMIDAGAITYFSICKDLAHVAGVFDLDDWTTVDVRANRFRHLFNDEYGNACLGELVGMLTLPSQQLPSYSMMQHSDGPTRMMSHIPYSILDSGDYTRSVGPMKPGVTTLPPKNDRYVTTRGVLTLDDYNRTASGFRPAAGEPRFRHLCEGWVKHHYDDPLADELYGLAQAQSRNLAGKGAGLTREDIERLR